MVYVKSLLAGVAFAFVACVVWILATVVVPFIVPVVIGRISGTGGVAVAYMSSGPLLVIALVAFVVGFWWRLRRANTHNAL